MRLKNIFLIMAICISGAACSQSGNPNYENATVKEFAADIADNPSAYILDVRTPQEFDEGHIADAHNLNWLDRAEFDEGAARLPKDETIYVYCRSGGRSAQACSYLAEKGYKVVNMLGGYNDWVKSH